MSVLTIIQDFCRRTNISVPTTVVSSNDEQIVQILNLLEEEGQDLAQRGDWQVLVNEVLHTTLATESQGTIEALAPGFDRFKPNTFWDRDLRLPVYILTNVDWQQEKATDVSGPTYQARIRGNQLLAEPIPEAGHTWAFEYVSRYWVTDLNGSNPSDEFTADTDLVLLPEKIVKLGLRWRWKKEKGFDYDEDFQTYEKMIKKSLGSDALGRNINLGYQQTPPEPQIYISDGSWLLQTNAIPGYAIPGKAIPGKLSG